MNINTINLKNGFSFGEMIETKDLARKGKRDSVPLKILNKIDEDGFEVTEEDFKNLHFDNSGRYFEDKEASRKQIDKIIFDLLSGNPIMPVIIDRNGNVIDGQHRMCAFKVLNILKIPVLKSVVYDTVFDNITSRANKLNIDLDEDFYKKEYLKENKAYNNDTNKKIKKPKRRLKP